jgi:glycosyltransferase involved in cell wall biosynthesis
MTSPRFSVVIPTREGANTLRHTLRTCLEQDFDDYEVVVCDNGGSPATRQVVEQCGSARVRLICSDRPLAMSSNWELAVSHARGDYVTVLGDDDALLPHALRVLDYLVRRTGARALRWDAAFYLWPTIALPEEANYLRLPTSSEFETVEARQAIASIIRFEACYSTLPMLYNSVVERGLLDELRRRAGRLFLTRYPDVCSGFMVASAVGRYVSSGLPMSVAGLSHKSVGVGHHMIAKQNAIGEEFLRLNAGEGVWIRRLVPDLHVFPVVPVADCFQAVKDALFPDDTLALDRKTVASQCVSCLRTDSEEHWRHCLAVIRDTLADDPALLEWFDAELAGQPPNVTGHLPLRSAWLGFDQRYLHLDTAAFGIEDVHGAAGLCDRLLGLRNADLASWFNEGGGAAPSGLHLRELREKEDVIQQLRGDLRRQEAALQRLAVESSERLKIIHALQGQSEVQRPPRGLLGRVVGKLRRVRDRWRGAA